VNLLEGLEADLVTEVVLVVDLAVGVDLVDIKAALVAKDQKAEANTDLIVDLEVTLQALRIDTRGTKIQTAVGLLIKNRLQKRHLLTKSHLLKNLHIKNHLLKSHLQKVAVEQESLQVLVDLIDQVEKTPQVDQIRRAIK
jgi:hypothetical protein